MTAAYHALRARGAPLEYWFVRAQNDTLAFLVDFIIRRKQGTAEIRSSYWVRGKGRVAHDVSRTWEDLPAGLRIGTSLFDATSTSGRSNEVSWDLRFAPGRWLEPGRAAAPLRIFDMQIASAPGSRLSGSVTVAGEAFTFDDSPGVVSHYWGVRLPDRWCWLSLNTDAVAAEALVAYTRVWRTPLRLPIGYTYVRDALETRYVISPLTGAARATGPGAAINVRSWRPFGRGSSITATQGLTSANDVGEGITQSLVADGLVDGQRVAGRMGLETRGWS